MTSPGFSSNSSRRTFPIGTLQSNFDQHNDHPHSDEEVGNAQSNLVDSRSHKNIIDLTSDKCTVSKITLQNNPDHKLNEQSHYDKEARNALDLSVQFPKQTLSFNTSVELAISQTTQDSSQNVQFSPQSTEWFSSLPLIDIPNQANQIKVTPSTLSRHNYPRKSFNHRPFPKRWRIIKIPSYRTAHRHHSLEWLIHLDAVYRVTRQ